ncbi:MAG: alpha/beta hydrolase [Capnocytophaga sp.]|nr:alpha/beta hydrolase [Capnocytophaga sp.]
MKTEKTEYYIFDLSDNVIREKVTYKNRYGIDIVADMYVAKDLDKTKKHPALVVGPPHGGVKEQGPGVYGNQLAQRGFVVIAFDQPFMGESGGEPRHISSPEMFSESFSAGVDFLGSLPYVDRQKIGAVGICASGGFALSAAQVDTRIKAVATTSMFDLTAAARGLATPEQVKTLLPVLGEQRWADFENGTPEVKPMYPAQPTDFIPESFQGPWAEFYSFYGMKRGHHPRSHGAFTTTSQLSALQFRLLDFIEEISPRPILFIIGENAFSNFFSENAYKAAAEPKELLVIPNANHIDLYDDVNKIPFDKLETFFTENLK